MLAVEVAQSVSEPARSIIIGYLIAVRRTGGMGSTFAIRTTVSGLGIEMVFPIYSPLVTKIEFLQRSNEFKRSKLRYLKNGEKGSLALEMSRKMDARVEEWKKRYILADRTRISLVK